MSDTKTTTVTPTIPQPTPVLSLRDVVVYPYMVIPLFVGRERSILALDKSMDLNKRIILVTQRSADVDDPAEADLFAPCALGAIINEETIPRLKCKIVAGPANNQLANNEAGNELERRGILYAPDYAVNAGGLMNVSIEFEGWNKERALRMTRTIYYNLGRIFKIADRDGIPTWQAADRMAEERIEILGKLKLPYMGKAHRFPGRDRKH